MPREPVSSAFGNAPSASMRERVVRALLHGELADHRLLNYEPTVGWHRGMILTGLGVKMALDALEDGLDNALLYVPAAPDTAWAWLSSATQADMPSVNALRSLLPSSVTGALGPPGYGLAGWRDTHMLACAALPIAVQAESGLVSCADVVLEAAVLKDAALARLLHDTYVAPLSGLLRDRDTVVHETLRTYFTSGYSKKVTAARLSVDRRTVWYRLERIGSRLGYPPQERRAELEVALRLAALTDSGARAAEASK